MRHYDYLDTRTIRNKRQIILYIGFALVFFALQGFIDLSFKIPFIIIGNLIVLGYSYLELNKELMIITVLMAIAQLSRLT
jgi:hypothetical protein